MGILEDVQGHRPEALKHYEAALKQDSSGGLQHDQYGLKIDRAWVEERLKTPFTWGKKK